MLKHQKSKLLYIYRQQFINVSNSCSCPFIFRTEEVSVRARRWVDGYNPLAERLEQWLSCRYRTDHTSLLQKSLSLYSPQQFVTRPLFIFLEKKKKKDESKVPVREVKEKSGDEEKKKEKPKAHAPSHAKIRSIGNLTNSKCYSFGSFKFCMKCSTCFLPRRTGDGHSKPGPP